MPQKSANSFLKDTFITSILGIAGKSMGFLIPFFVAAWFGVSRETDAFFFAYEIVFYLLSILSPVIENVIVPYISEMPKHSNGRFVGSVMMIGAALLSAVTIILLIFAKPLIALVTNFPAQDIALIHVLLAETAVLVVFVVASSTIAGVLNAYKKFYLPAISPAVRGIVTLLIIFMLKDKLGIHSLAVGYVCGDLVRLIILLAALKISKACKIVFSLKPEQNVVLFFKTAGFQIAAMSITGLFPCIDKALASWLSEGSVSVLYYAYRLYLIPVTFFMTGLMVTVLSYWSEKFTQAGADELKKDVIKVSGFVIAASLLISALLYACSDILVKIAYGRGALNAEILNEIKWIVRCFLFGFTLDVMYHIFVRANICMKNTRAIMYSSILMIALSIVFKTAGMKLFGAPGIALGFSLCLLPCVVYLGYSFNKLCKSPEYSNE